MRRLLPALASLALFIALPAPALIYYSEQNMPLNGQDKNGQPVGLAVELLRLMWREMGEPEQPIHFLPWARGWYLLTQQQEAVLFTTAHTKERDPHFLWVCPISHSRVALVGRKQDAPKVASKADLAKLQIGVMQADVGEQLLLNRGISPGNMMSVERMEQVVRQLIMARTDLVAGNEVMLQGLDTEAIAAELGIGSGTVKNHRKHLYGKLRLGSRAELFNLFLNHLITAPVEASPVSSMGDTTSPP